MPTAYITVTVAGPARAPYSWRPLIEWDRFDIVQSSACRLESLLNERNWPHVDLVLSGLPFVLPGAVKKPMLSAIKGLTDRGTVFRFFTYMPPLMKPHYRMFQLRRVCFVLRNFPPMYIYSVN